MILTPICLQSHSPASSFCHSQGCPLTAFSCTSCPNQSCLRRHKHNSRNIAFWDEITCELYEMLYGSGLSEDDMREIKWLEVEVQAISKALTGVIERHQEEIIKQRTVMWCGEPVKRVLGNVRDRKTDGLTGGDMHVLLKAMNSGRTQVEKTIVQEKVRMLFQKLKTLLADISTRIKTYETDLLASLNPKQLKLKADKFRTESNYGKAAELYTLLVELDNRDAYSYNCRGVCNFCMREYNKAIADYSSAIKVNANQTLIWANRANAYIHIKQYKKAVEDCNQAIKLNPANDLAYGNRALAYHNLSQFQKAIIDFSQAIKYNPKLSTYFSNRSQSYIKICQYEKAISDCQNAIKIDANNYIAYNNRGHCFNQLGSYQKGLDDCSIAIKIDPTNDLAYGNRAQCFGNLGQLDKAIADYTIAIQINPKNVILFINRGHIYFALKQYNKAIEDYTQALRLEPNNKEYYMWRANVYEISGQKDSALLDQKIMKKMSSKIK